MPQADNSQLPAFSAADTPSRQLLLIDDDQDMSETSAEFLAPEGYAVHLAHTAKAGLDRAKQPRRARPASCGSLLRTAALQLFGRRTLGF
jgi:CheY-like chemotaxis protein